MPDDLFAKLKEGDAAIQPVATEGPIGQNISVFTDPHLNDTVFLENVKGVDDLFKECPVCGDINLDREFDGESIKGLLKGLPEVIDDLITIASNAEACLVTDGSADKFSVSDSKWTEERDPAYELAWKSAILAQIQAKLNAMENYLMDPSDFRALDDPLRRKNAAALARHLAEELQHEALNEIVQSNIDDDDKRRAKVAESMEHFKKYVTADGFTRDQLAELFRGGE